jgi:hypothetical protein
VVATALLSDTRSREEQVWSMTYDVWPLIGWKQTQLVVTLLSHSYAAVDRTPKAITTVLVYARGVLVPSESPTGGTGSFGTSMR